MASVCPRSSLELQLAKIASDMSADQDQEKVTMTQQQQLRVDNFTSLSRSRDLSLNLETTISDKPSTSRPTPPRSMPISIPSTSSPSRPKRPTNELIFDQRKKKDLVYNARINEYKEKMFIGDRNRPIATGESSDEAFELIEDLGFGSSGHVTKRRHKKSNVICAVKQMRRSGDDEENKRIYMDLQTVLECNCDNIVDCYGFIVKEAEVWICMELMTTCFDKLMKKLNRGLPEKFLGAIAFSVLKALDYLKDTKKIIHRDIKPSNILINNEGQIKLCDFGISGKLVNSLAKTRSAGCIWYMAPERVDPNQKPYDVRSDVWSLGMTLLELATAKSPFKGMTEFDVIFEIINNDPPTLPNDINFSDEFRDFISVCLTKDYKLRPKHKQLMQHEFILKHMNVKVSLDELK